MLLDTKNAVIYGGGGSIGGAVARSFAREGASVFLAGRTEAKARGGGRRHPPGGRAGGEGCPHALDEEAVDRHADDVAARAGSIDISFNLISHPHAHGVPFHGMEVGDFMAPVEVAARTTFNHRSGRGAPHDPPTLRCDSRVRRARRPQRATGRLLPRWDAGRLRRDRDDPTATLGRVRSARNPVRHLASGTVPETFPDHFDEAPQITKMIEGPDAARAGRDARGHRHAAVFAASDWARSMMAAIVNVSCGALID